MKKPNDIDDYISGFPSEIQKILQQLRTTIKKAAPQATETISYRMPAFKLKEVLVFFAAHSQHIGFYPTPSGIEAFKKELSVYKGAKGSVQFPIDKPMPLELVAEIAKFRVAEILEKAKNKGK